MTYVVAAPVVLFLLALAYGGLTGRIRTRTATCCTTADPAQDLRMRDVLPES